MNISNYQYRRNLPHIQPPEGTFFITYMLKDCIPKVVWKQLILDYEKDCQNLQATITSSTEPLELPYQNKLKYDLQKKYFGKLDHFLDNEAANCGTPWLKNEAIAQVVQNSIIWADNRHYKLWTACIMPTHVHLLLTLLPNAPILYQVLQSIKSYSGREANKIRQQSGQFWQRESYDHIVRPNGEFQRIQNYILNNPVKAGLVTDWQDYKWTYLAP